MWKTQDDLGSFKGEWCDAFKEQMKKEDRAQMSR
jgi:hypothetical protein